MDDGQDIRRMKRSLYYSVNMLRAKVGYACKQVLIHLFKLYCSHMYGCEVWQLDRSPKAFRELCVAYHSCVKKLMKVPIWTRNHELCHQLGLLPCPMLVAKRQLLFHLQITQSENDIVKSLRSSVIGSSGIIAKEHMKIRQSYGLLNMDFTFVSRGDIANMFVYHLKRVIRDRAKQCQDQISNSANVQLS